MPQKQTHAAHLPVRAANLPAPVGPYSPGMGFERLIFVSGQGATDPATGKLAGHDVETQTVQCLKNIEAALTRAGASFAQVVRTRLYVVNIADWEQIGRAHGAVFGTIRPTTAMVEVSRLISPEMLVEIEADAWLGE